MKTIDAFDLMLDSFRLFCVGLRGTVSTAHSGYEDLFWEFRIGMTQRGSFVIFRLLSPFFAILKQYDLQINLWTFWSCFVRNLLSLPLSKAKQSPARL